MTASKKTRQRRFKRSGANDPLPADELIALSADPDALYRIVVGVASGSVTKAEVAVFLQQNTRGA